MALADLITLIVVLALIGFCLWLVLTYIPMPPPFKTALIVVIVVLIILYLVRLLVGDLRIGAILSEGGLT